MAYDVTALQTAIAEGRVNEGEAVQLLNEFYNWELKVAKLLTVKTEPEAPASETVHEPTPEELAQPEQPVESTSTAETETPATEETPAAEQPAEQPTE